MTTLQSVTVAGLLADLGLSGYNGITMARNSGDHTHLDITVTPPAYAILGGTTLLSGELVSTSLHVLLPNGTYTLWLHATTRPTGLTPVWTVAATAPVPTAIALAVVVISGGTISTVTPATAGLQGLPSAATPGVPVLYGPYVVDYTDIPHDGDTMTLWVPAVGDVLLRLFPDWRTWVQWDHGSLAIGQDINTDGPAYNFWFSPSAGNLGGLDLLFSGSVYNNSATNNSAYAVPIISTDPVQIKLSQTPGTDPTTGHVEIYALIARAVVP